jgi:hypothetical protein
MSLKVYSLLKHTTESNQVVWVACGEVVKVR